jgi:hypothetical protein
MIKKSPVIISDKLSQEETLRLITVLEKHRSTFGYSLQDLQGISPTFAPIASLQILIFYHLGSPSVGLTIR